MGGVSCSQACARASDGNDEAGSEPATVFMVAPEVAATDIDCKTNGNHEVQEQSAPIASDDVDADTTKVSEAVDTTNVPEVMPDQQLEKSVAEAASPSVSEQAEARKSEGDGEGVSAPESEAHAGAAEADAEQLKDAEVVNAAEADQKVVEEAQAKAEEEEAATKKAAEDEAAAAKKAAEAKKKTAAAAAAKKKKDLEAKKKAEAEKKKAEEEIKRKAQEEAQEAKKKAKEEQEAAERKAKEEANAKGFKTKEDAFAAIDGMLEAVGKVKGGFKDLQKELKGVNPTRNIDHFAPLKKKSEDRVWPAISPIVEKYGFDQKNWFRVVQDACMIESVLQDKKAKVKYLKLVGALPLTDQVLEDVENKLK